METRLVSRSDVMEWVIPQFQRPLRVNEKVRLMAAELKENGGFVGGVITLGRIGAGSSLYLVDGQHRREAFLISELGEAIADVRTITFDTMAEMAQMFVLLQGHLVQMRPDDVLRGLEDSVPQLHKLREQCPFVGYDQIRRGTNSPVVSASQVIKAWTGSRSETPVNTTGSRTAAQLIQEMDSKELDWLVIFLNLAREAWGNDPENARLWGNVNITMCMWLLRRLVMDQDRSAKRAAVVSIVQFKKCLSSLSANSDYIDWLANRTLTDHHRMPCYRRIRTMFVARLREETGKALKMPTAAWTTN